MSIVRRTVTDRAVFIEIDRPDKRNALDVETSTQLRAAFQDSLDARLPIVLRSTTPGLFVSGADIADLAQRTRVEALAQLNHELFLLIEEHPSPTIAVVDGHALGGGCELALACDFRISTTRASWGLPEVTLGIIPSAGGLWRLPRLIGWGAATDLILTGRRIRGEEAQRLGLVSRLCEEDDLEATLDELLDQLSRASPTAIGYAKKAMQAPAGKDRTAEAALQALCFESEDAQTRLGAFLAARRSS